MGRGKKGKQRKRAGGGPIASTLGVAGNASSSKERTTTRLGKLEEGAEDAETIKKGQNIRRSEDNSDSANDLQSEDARHERKKRSRSLSQDSNSSNGEFGYCQEVSEDEEGLQDYDPTLTDLNEMETLRGELEAVKLPTESDAEQGQCNQFGLWSNEHLGIYGSEGRFLSDFIDEADAWGISEMDQETFAFLWTIKPYSAAKGLAWVKSPTFQFRGRDRINSYWQLKMCPSKRFGEQDYVSLHLILTGSENGDTELNKPINARFRIVILDANDEPQLQAGGSTMSVCAFRKLRPWGFDQFILTSNLLKPAHQLVKNDSLKVHCRVWIEGRLTDKVYDGEAKMKRLSKEEKAERLHDWLVEDFRKLFSKPILTDISIITTGGTILAHKAILQARSSVFRVMLEGSGGKQEKIKTMEILDFSENVVRTLIEYLYTGAVQSGLMFDFASELLMIAEKYDVTSLRENCEYEIEKQLDFDNATEILVMAEVYNATYLKSRALDYIKRYKKQVKKTKSYKKSAQKFPEILSLIDK